jgi:hypothetical protein
MLQSTTRLILTMVNPQASACEALGESASTQDIELTSFISLDPRMRDYNEVVLSDQHESITPSTEALHQPLDSDHIELARQFPLQLREDTSYSSFPTNFQHRSAVKRVGAYSAVILAATTTFMLLVLSFLTFLWTARRESSFWRLIIVSGWAVGAVTVSSLLLQTAVYLQAGVAVAMLAAILLETDHVLLVDTAQVSKLRAGRAAPLDIMIISLRTWQFGKNRSLFEYIRILGVLILVATTFLLQFTSTMLVSDLSLGTLPGMASRGDLRFDFIYSPVPTTEGPYPMLTKWDFPHQPRAASTWFWNPSAFPAFAEFSEPVDVPDNVDDTGHVLRSFLPFQDAQSRETISDYFGKAMVLDARVSCQRPHLLNTSVSTERPEEVFSFTGQFTTTEDVHRLLGTTGPTPFNCTIGSGRGYSISIC